MPQESTEQVNEKTETPQTPKLKKKDPSILPSVATTSKKFEHQYETFDPSSAPKRKWWKYFYDRQNKTFCDRTCRSWLYIISYAIMYSIFLSTYTMIFLYGSLAIIKSTEVYKNEDKSEFLQYPEEGVGLTATPTSENDQLPLIWYRKGNPDDFKKYVNAIETLFKSRKKRELSNDTNLGVCGLYPYGYGESPCVFIRINKQLRWTVKALNEDSINAKDAPKSVQNWMKTDKKLWLHCDGYHSYDKEHIGEIRYYPYPPGIDPNIFPLGPHSKSPLIAVQFSRLTIGISIGVECRLWQHSTSSTIRFVIYISPSDYSMRLNDIRL